MITHKFLDWLQYSIDEKHAPMHDDPKILGGFEGYRYGWQNPDGTKVYTGHNKSQKALVIHSGQPMQKLRSIIDELDYIDDVLSKGAKFSRVDLAMDIYIHDDFIKPSDFLLWHMQGLIKSSHAEVDPTFIGKQVKKREMETVSFGDLAKRGKKGMVRVYDKGIELDLDRYLITRVEVEDKREKAHTSAKRLLKHSVAEVLKTRFDVDHEKFQKAINAESIDITRGNAIDKEKEDGYRSRWTWLIETVAPVLGREIAKDELAGNFGNRDLFEKEMTIAYHEYIRKNSFDKKQI